MSQNLDVEPSVDKCANFAAISVYMVNVPDSFTIQIRGPRRVNKREHLVHKL